jgi:peptidoglycan/LPS O-acetylase OafA/YrhL
MSTEPLPASEHARIAHLPALDGLRGLAVVGVLLFHVGWLKGGYLGVDLFFVLSGFLITTLLLVEWQSSQRISLTNFWIRRARRLLPALLAVLLAVALYAQVFAESTELGRIRSDAFATLAYVANWRAIFRGTNYWALFTAPSPLEHTWSLAIEEQFYVVWPLLVTLVLRLFKGKARAVFVLCVALALGSMVAMAALFSVERVSRVYMGTDTRGTSILAGAALACVVAHGPTLVHRWQRIVLDVLGAIASVWLAYAWTTLDGQSSFLYHGGFWLAELAVLVLLCCAREGKQSLIGRLFMFRPLTSLGLISYGLYLWHWPLFVVFSETRAHLSGPWLGVTRLGVSLLVAIVSYYVLELPIRRHGIRVPRVVVPVTALVLVVAIVFSTRGATALPSDVLKVTQNSTLPTETAQPGSWRVLVVGDSVALSLGERMQSVASRHDATVVTRAVGNCSLFEQVVPALSLDKRAHDGGNCGRHWEDDARALKPDVALVVLGGGYFARAQVDGRWQSACESGWTRVYRQELHAKLVALAHHASRVVIARVPYPAGGSWDPERWHRQVDCFNTILQTESAEVANLQTLDLKDHLCPLGVCKLKSHDALIRPDGMHFQGPGAEESADWVLDSVHQFAKM